MTGHFLAENVASDVLLVNPPYPRRHGGGLVPPVGLCYLAAALRQVGATTEIIDISALWPEYRFGDDEPIEILRQCLANRVRPPQLIGIGPVVTATLRSTRDLIESCREQTGAPIVIGGALCAAPGMSAVATDYLRADAYVAGDGETAIQTLWRAAAQGAAFPAAYGIGLPGRPEPAPFREDSLDALPLPARDLLRHGYHASARRTVTGEDFTSAFLSRGCPYSCTFCAAPLASGRRVRRVSGPRITEELTNCGALGYKNIVFYDDCLFVRSPTLDARVLEFCDAVGRAQWTGNYQLELRCDAVVLLSDQALRALVQSGCRQVNMGIEKAHITQLALLKKRLTPDVAREACERVNGAGLRAAGTFILGGEGETPDQIESTIDFALSLPLTFAHFNPLAVYPGTTLFSQVFANRSVEDWLSLCLDDELAPAGDILWRSADLPLGLILRFIQDAYRKFYSTERLVKICRALPDLEAKRVETAYSVLASDRALSWDMRSGNGGRLSDSMAEGLRAC